MKLIQTTTLKSNGKRRYMWALFECPTCGSIVEVRKDAGLKQKTCKECAKKKRIQAVTIHGESNTVLFRKWASMKYRCNNPNSHLKKWYYNKGVKLCDEWEESFLAFKEWAYKSGYKEGLCIDRIDPNKGYSPENCQWLTNTENLKKMHKDKRRENES
ncbi:MAG: hypothetical protein B6U76_00050 [Desulfurococcales archaeon ex4484_217_2]|nr:MAG: hypothetical protein B6U76_00050 [Desulfurococcales archaeon ex4484_217_2]